MNLLIAFSFRSGNWRSLLLSVPSISEAISQFESDLLEAEVAIPGGCRLKLHCGPGKVKRNKVEENEIRFILDNDIFMLGKIEVKYSAGALNTVHTNADRVFRGQITPTLHNAMEPI